MRIGISCSGIRLSTCLLLRIDATTVTDYRDHGIFGFGEDSTIKVSYSSTAAAQNSVIPGQIGVLLDGGANGVIDHNKVSLNLVAGAVAKLTTTP